MEQSLADGYPPTGEIVTCRREGEYYGALGMFNGRDWEVKGKPEWFRDIHVLLPMMIPTHWKR